MSGVKNEKPSNSSRRKGTARLASFLAMKTDQGRTWLEKKNPMTDLSALGVIIGRSFLLRHCRYPFFLRKSGRASRLRPFDRERARSVRTQYATYEQICQGGE